MIKQRSINPRDTAILNIYASNRALKQKLIKLPDKSVTSTILIGDFGTPILVLDRTNKQTISKDFLVDQKDTISQLDLTDSYRTTAEHFHPCDIWHIFRKCRPYFGP